MPLKEGKSKKTIGENIEELAGEARHMADGGYVDDEDPRPMPSTPPPTPIGPPGSSVPPAPPPQIINQDAKRYAFTPGKNGSLTAQMPPAPEKPLVPEKTLPGTPNVLASKELEDYLSGKMGQIGKYGAADQMGLQNQINTQRNSLGNRLTDAGKGFADALMMGVARAGNPNWQGQYEAQQNEIANQNLGTMRGANEANLKQVEAGMSMDKMDASSPLSKSAQQNYAPLFQKLGYPPSAIGKMSAANIESALGLMATYGGKQIEAEIKKYEFDLENKKLDVESQNIASEVQSREQQRAQEAQKLRQGNLEDLAKMPWYSRVLHPGIAKTMEQNAGMGDYTPDVTAYAEKHGITPDQALQIKKSRGG